MLFRGVITEGYMMNYRKEGAPVILALNKMPFNFNSKDLMNPLEKESAKIRSVDTSPVDFSPTVILGLLTELDCFKAIKELGDTKFFLKKQLVDESQKVLRNEEQIQKLCAAIQQVHTNQLIIVNDVCKRFGVVHPDIKYLSAEMKKHTLYWDWYSDQHLKVYGSRPAIKKDNLPGD